MKTMIRILFFTLIVGSVAIPRLATARDASGILQDLRSTGVDCCLTEQGDISGTILAGPHAIDVFLSTDYEVDSCSFRTIWGGVTGLSEEPSLTEEQLEWFLVDNANRSLGGSELGFGNEDSIAYFFIPLPADADKMALKSAMLTCARSMVDVFDKVQEWNTNRASSSPGSQSSDAVAEEAAEAVEHKAELPTSQNGRATAEEKARSFWEKLFAALVAALGWIFHAIKWCYEKLWSNMVRLWPKGTLGRIEAILLGIVGALPILCILRWINKKLSFTEHVGEGFWAELTRGLDTGSGKRRSSGIFGGGGGRASSPPKPVPKKKEYVCVYCRTVFTGGWSRGRAMMLPCSHHPRGFCKGPHKIVEY